MISAGEEVDGFIVSSTVTITVSTTVLPESSTNSIVKLYEPTSRPSMVLIILSPVFHEPVVFDTSSL